ncbi:unnamed protein product [Effrenium voratum]|uniref:Pentatricopeptide repeat-containing protein n=1 Tax=Effrenium voratum TaxID=2562239 RepID=A0AA36MY37_9DINO|nr:unnamed protein product [Effrenium voratum]
MFAALTGQIVKLGKAKRWAESLQLWADLRARDNSERLVFAKCAVIAACGLATQWQLSLHLISDLPVDDACCCAAISACDKGLEWEQALAVFDQMPRLQLLPSTHSYNATISACTRCARWPRALALFECVPRPNAVVFNTTIAGCGKGQQWHWAMHLFSQMRQAGQRPDAVTYGSLASTFERVSEWEKALALHGEMVSANALDAMSYGALVSACERTLTYGIHRFSCKSPKQEPQQLSQGGRRWHEAAMRAMRATNRQRSAQGFLRGTGLLARDETRAAAAWRGGARCGYWRLHQKPATGRRPCALSQHPCASPHHQQQLGSRLGRCRALGGGCATGQPNSADSHGSGCRAFCCGNLG